jgi:5-deoxy-glucuronate isomerase
MVNMSKSKNILVKPNFELPEFIQVTPMSAGWEHLNFSAVKLQKGTVWHIDSKDNEMALVIFGGTAKIETKDQSWESVGSRNNVFNGMPTTLYISRNNWINIYAIKETVEFGIGWCKAFSDHPTKLIEPEDVKIEIRGGGNATRQINQMIMPGFDCDRLVVVEVYTPSGNWSSYPPHKHDVRKLDQNGNLLEADLEEIYFYKIDRPEGYAYQRVYTDDRHIDELVLVKDNELVLSPEGYHPVVAAHGFNIYYLNMLAGSDQSLASSDDPEFAWIKNTWNELDRRLPMVTLEMNKKNK